MSLQQNIWNNGELVKFLKDNKIVIMPTDTIYGIVGNALDKEVVERIYKTRKRSPEKPCIILISDTGELEKFSVNLREEQKDIIENFSTPTSFILECQNEELKYLHRGTNTLAFRIPLQSELRKLLKETGPLVAPSANIEGMPPSVNINEAKAYFGDYVEFYVDGGELKGNASKVIKLNKDGSISVLRA